MRPLFVSLILLSTSCGGQGPSLTSGITVVFTSHDEGSASQSGDSPGAMTDPMDTGDTLEETSLPTTAETTAPSMQTGSTTTDTPTTDISTTDVSTTDISETTTPETTDPTNTPCSDPEGQSFNSPCTDASGCGCASGHCYIVPQVGGWCGECNVDTDCPNAGGCTMPDPVHKYGSHCNKGQYSGDGCMTSNACHSANYPDCNEAFKLPGGTVVKGCSECLIDADCSEGYLCRPEYDLPVIKGHLRCQYAGDDNQLGYSYGCFFDSDCEPGYCADIEISPGFVVPACSGCEDDADCIAQGDTKCVGGGYEFEELQAKYCE